MMKSAVRSPIPLYQLTLLKCTGYVYRVCAVHILMLYSYIHVVLHVVRVYDELVDLVYECARHLRSAVAQL